MSLWPCWRRRWRGRRRRSRGEGGGAGGEQGGGVEGRERGGRGGASSCCRAVARLFPCLPRARVRPQPHGDTPRPATPTHTHVHCVASIAHTRSPRQPAPTRAPVTTFFINKMPALAHGMRPPAAPPGSRPLLPPPRPRPGGACTRPFPRPPAGWSSQPPLASWEGDAQRQAFGRATAPLLAADRRADAAAWDAVDTLSTLGAVAGAVAFVLTQEVRARERGGERGRAGQTCAGGRRAGG